MSSMDNSGFKGCTIIKKTIYYDNALIKVYNIRFIFQNFTLIQRLIEDRFLTHQFLIQNLGSGISIPYFLQLIKIRILLSEVGYMAMKIIFTGEYHQAFKNSNLLTDFGYTKGYKKLIVQKAG